MNASWQQELHDKATWFESWMSGTVSETEDAFARLADSLHEDFLLVRDTGRIQTREQLCDEIRGCHGLRKGRRVWMENEQLRHQERADDVPPHNSGFRRGFPNSGPRFWEVCVEGISLRRVDRCIRLHEVI